MVRYLTCSKRQKELQREKAQYDQQQYHAKPQDVKYKPNRRGRPRKGTSTTSSVSQRSTRSSTTTYRRLNRVEFDDKNILAQRLAQTRAVHEQSDSDRFYVIEKLLDKRFVAGREEYLVRWQNYPPEWDSWEPRTELERNAIDMIREFNNMPGPSTDDQPRCICRRPYRFDQGGLIQCVNCHEWYHFTCLKMNMAEANAYSKWHCSDCMDANPSLKNLIKPDKQAQLI